MVIREGRNFVEITALERIPAHLPTPGDTRLAVRVQAEAFVGQGTTWVDLPALQRFADDLADLDLRRSGKAELCSMSPHEFRLAIEAIDGWGHTAVSGRLMKAKQTIEFSFEFNVELLPQLLSDFRDFATWPA